MGSLKRSRWYIFLSQVFPHDSKPKVGLHRGTRIRNVPITPPHDISPRFQSTRACLPPPQFPHRMPTKKNGRRQKATPRPSQPTARGRGGLTLIALENWERPGKSRIPVEPKSEGRLSSCFSMYQSSSSLDLRRSTRVRKRTWKVWGRQLVCGLFLLARTVNVLQLTGLRDSGSGMKRS